MTPVIVVLLVTAGVGPAVDSIGMTVSDLDRSVAFYTQVLSFEKVSEVELQGQEIEQVTGVFGSHIRRARLKLGSEFIELTEFLAPQGRLAPADQRSNDRWFQHIAIITSDMDRAYRHLRQYKVKHASPSPQTLPAWNPNAGGIRAFYFLDPDGHALEVLSFPPDKGSAKWHATTDSRFLGIDHTAIVISDTETSLSFYRDILGMNVAGESENCGVEQERLNNVFGARLRITSLKGVSGPGIEFLEYLTPRDGRPYPPEERTNDLIHWQTRLDGGAVDTIAQRLRKARAAFVSTGVSSLPPGISRHRKVFTVRDPDGHAVEIVE